MRCMPRMVRKQAYIEPRQEKLLKRRARELKVTEAELIRRGIDQLARFGVVRLPDPDAWAAERRYIMRNRRMKVPQTGRTWTRAELYEERLGRFSR